MSAETDPGAFVESLNALICRIPQAQGPYDGSRIFLDVAEMAEARQFDPDVVDVFNEARTMPGEDPQIVKAARTALDAATENGDYVFRCNGWLASAYPSVGIAGVFSAQQHLDDPLTPDPFIAAYGENYGHMAVVKCARELLRLSHGFDLTQLEFSTQYIKNPWSLGQYCEPGRRRDLITGASGVHFMQGRVDMFNVLGHMLFEPSLAEHAKSADTPIARFSGFADRLLAKQLSIVMKTGTNPTIKLDTIIQEGRDLLATGQGLN